MTAPLPSGSTIYPSVGSPTSSTETAVPNNGYNDTLAILVASFSTIESLKMVVLMPSSVNTISTAISNLIFSNCSKYPYYSFSSIARSLV
jgi:hypothetical protein